MEVLVLHCLAGLLAYLLILYDQQSQSGFHRPTLPADARDLPLAMSGGFLLLFFVLIALVLTRFKRR